MKQYKQRFIQSNVLLVGIALLAALTVQGIFLYRNTYQELRNTMNLILDPWNAPEHRPEPGTQLRPKEDVPPPESQSPDERPNGRRRPENENGIVAVFYDKDTDEISLLSPDSFLDETAVADAVREVVERKEPFGKTSASGLIYYKEGTFSECRIALAQTSYVTARMTKHLLVLLLIYALAMGLVLLISILLSRLAARPMEDALSMQKRFIDDISHDLKMPITIILANNSILKSNPDRPKDSDQWLDSTEDAAKNMMKLVDEMLTLSSLEAQSRRPEMGPVSLSSLAEKAALQLESLSFERSVTIDTDIQPDVTVSADPDYVERICSGLIENALKYEPSGGRIFVEVRAAKKKAELTVRNAGSVIAPEDAPHVFDRFYRGDKARDTGSGHGLGLPIIKGMADALGAQIALTSDADTGTQFTVQFDCIPQSAQTAETGQRNL